MRSDNQKKDFRKNTTIYNKVKCSSSYRLDNSRNQEIANLINAEGKLIHQAVAYPKEKIEYLLKQAH